MIRTFLLIFLLGSVVRATPLDSDLGQGLAYHRVHALPADLPKSDSQSGKSCVLDLRYATGDADAALALAGWLKFHAAATTPVFVLANTDTSSALLNVLSRRDHTAGLVLLGAAAAGFTPDIALAVAPATERSAYDAAEHGTSFDTLLNPPNDKPRNDEAKLAHDRQPEAAQVESDAPESPLHPPEAAPAKVPAPPPLVDLVLQRAVHLHRALVALKKI
jgi:hypothetical protein